MRLLVLDAMPERSRGVAAALQGSGFTLDQLDCLGDAAEALCQKPYRGMVLRRRFADGDGVAWLRQRRVGGVPIPAVMMMSASTVEDRVEALEAGVDDCVQTPIDERELVARVRAVLRRPLTLEAPLLRAGNVVMNQQSREVWIRKIPIMIPRREMCLLEHLMRRFHRVVPRAMLEDNIYGYAEDWCSNSLEVRISRVRRHLASTGADISIQTVRGIGYMLRPA